MVQHEDLCDEPLDGFRALFDRLDVEFSADVIATIEERDRPATGYETKRVAADQSERWKSRLDDHQVETIRDVAASLSIEC